MLFVRLGPSSMPNKFSKIFKQRISKKTKLQLIGLGLVVLLLISYLVFDIASSGPLTSLLSNKERIVNLVNSLGFFGPLLYILLQILQTVAAPIPGQVVGTVGGFIFGWWGVLWTVIGSAIGFFIVFTLSRRFGRPLVEKIVKKDMLDKFDFIAGERAPFILFIIFLLPGLPDDIVCYVAGLTEVPIKKLMVMIVLGRLPAVIMTNYIGAGLGEENLTPVIIATVLTVIFLALIYSQKNRIMKYLSGQNS